MDSLRWWPRRYALACALLLVLAASGLAQQSASNECLVHVTLLQVNDVYQFAPVDRGAAGGLARLATLRKQAAKESPNTLFLLAGDTISPSVESNTYKGAQMIDAWNAVGIDFAVFGNHEFDFGPEVLIQRMKESRFTWLGANVVDAKTGKTFADTPPFVIREFQGIKLGIFGLTLPDTKNTSRPGPNVDFRDSCETAKKIVAQMKAQGAQVIIALTHLSLAEDKALAHCVEGIDLIIGGHEHTLLQSLAERTPIFKMTADAREMGRFELNISSATGKLQSIDWQVVQVNSQVAEDAEFAKVMSKYDALMKELAVPVGRTSVPLNAKSKQSRTQETNIGDFIADAFRKATGADVALVNGGSIRADDIIPAGELTEREVLSILPFANPVVKLEVTGAILRKALENGVSQSAEQEEPGRFPQVSGLRFSFDARRPSGSRVTAVTVGGQPLDDKKTYTLAASSFMAIEGGDGYEMLKSMPLIIKPEAAQKAPDVLKNAITSVASIAPQTDGRVTRLDVATDGGGAEQPCPPAQKNKR
ncbi:MAG: 5'-nucleotidase C-terminal domain-containing protein [Acidobacteria bacterium]|nr:5'-nucleotidase C-terminal domain-containing protein [Acidobacteriota bacterium]